MLNRWILASFLGLPTVQILIACSMQKQRVGRPGPFYHVNNVSIHLDRQSGEGSLIKTTSLRPYLVVSTPSTGVLNVRKVKNKLLLVQNKEQVCKMCFLLLFF